MQPWICTQPRAPESLRGLGGATPLGFEPRITPPKGAVLPLHHGVIGWPTYDSRRRNGSCNSGGRTTRDFAGNDRRLVTFGNRERLPYNLNLGRGAIPAVWAGECQSWCRCRRHWKAKFFRHALPPPIGAMARPRPVPLDFPCVMNGSKSLGNISGGMPTPVSEMRSTT